MSIKVYNGYRLRMRGDLQRLDAFLSDFGRQARALGMTLALRRVAADAAEMIDRVDLRLPVPTREYETKEDLSAFTSPLGYALRIFRVRYALAIASPIRDTYFDLTCSVTILPRGSQILALLFAEREEYEALWKRQKHVVEYGYWNNSDRPTSVSAAAWRRREHAWKPTFTTAPSLIGYSRDFIGKLQFSSLNESKILRAIPPKAERAVRWAKDLWLNERVAAEMAKGGTKYHGSIVNEQYRAIKADISGVARRAEACAAKLREIRMEDLQTSITHAVWTVEEK